MEGEIPGNIHDEFAYIINAYENDDKLNDEFVYAVVKAIDVYLKTGDSERAVEIKEAYRIADYLSKRGKNDGAILMREAGDAFVAGDMERGREVCGDVLDIVGRFGNTERCAVESLANIPR